MPCQSEWQPYSLEEDERRTHAAIISVSPGDVIYQLHLLALRRTFSEPAADA